MSKRDVSHKIVVEGVEGKTRVDSYIAQNLEGVSRSLVSDKDTQIFVDNKIVKNSFKVKDNQVIEIKYSETFFNGIEGEDISLDSLYEDEDILVINKEQGLVVHPGANNYEHTLVNALVYRYGDEFQDKFEDETSDNETLMRPGIVHRLDKDTSGVMVIALNRESQRNLSSQFKERETSKIYIAIVKGYVQKRRGRITTNIIRDPKDRKKYTTCASDKGKTADTSYLVLKQYKGYALVRINIHTGRTHQIRVHLKSINHPILGDPIYSNPDKKYPNETLMLHALQLELNHPKSKAKMRFRAAMPKRFKDFIKKVDPFVMEKGQSQKYYESAEKIRSK
jgi:23S rRNA pseudouridine1911/1915/1917 synthase